MTLAEPFAVALRLVASLERMGIEYLVGGSVASSVHGWPRSTTDVDIVARVAGRQASVLAEELAGDFYVDADMIREAVARKGSFNVVHLATMMKVDIFVFDGSSMAEEEMKRRTAIEVVPGKPPIFFSTAEDIVLQKLEWYRRGDEISDRQWSDLLGVLRVGQDRLDTAYMRKWAVVLGVSDLLERALAQSPGTVRE